jgi:anti-sigma factor RsiW
LSVRSAEDLLAQQVVASHVRSIMAPKPSDQESSNKHVLKPWLNNRLGFSPEVADPAEIFGLDGQRFRLEGARVDYLDDRLVAALVYMHDKHLINVYIWPAAPDSDASVRTISRQGYHLHHWIQSGMNYWVVSDLNEAELRRFVELIRK